MKGLRIPVKSLFKHERKDWHPVRNDYEDGTVTFYVLDTSICGTIEGEDLLVSHFDCSGEGSGTAMGWIYEPALMDGKGFLEVSTVWEGGDSIRKLVVKDGAVEWSDIEI